MQLRGATEHTFAWELEYHRVNRPLAGWEVWLEACENDTRETDTGCNTNCFESAWQCLAQPAEPTLPQMLWWFDFHNSRAVAVSWNLPYSFAFTWQRYETALLLGKSVLPALPLRRQLVANRTHEVLHVFAGGCLRGTCTKFTTATGHQNSRHNTTLQNVYRVRSSEWSLADFNELTAFTTLSSTVTWGPRRFRMNRASHTDENALERPYQHAILLHRVLLFVLVWYFAGKETSLQQGNRAYKDFDERMRAWLHLNLSFRPSNTNFAISAEIQQQLICKWLALQALIQERFVYKETEPFNLWCTCTYYLALVVVQALQTTISASTEKDDNAIHCMSPNMRTITLCDTVSGVGTVPH